MRSLALRRPPRHPNSPPFLGRRSAIAVLLVSLGLAACGSPEPTPSRTPAAIGSEATSAPTAPSTLPAFEGRLREATTREGALVRAIAAATTGNAADMRLAVGQMRAWVEGERAWLAANPSEPCYSAAASKFSAALDAMAASADGFLGSVEVSLEPSDDVTRSSIGSAAAQSLQDAARHLTEAAAIAKTSRTDCR